MRIRNVIRETVALEAVAFLVLLGLLWLDALFGWHHWPERKPPPVDWGGLRATTAVVLALAMLVMMATNRLQTRLFDLERFIRVCAWCRRVKVRHHWISMEEFLTTRLHKEATHGICPECAARERSRFVQSPRPGAQAA